MNELDEVEMEALLTNLSTFVERNRANLARLKAENKELEKAANPTKYMDYKEAHIDFIVKFLEGLYWNTNRYGNSEYTKYGPEHELMFTIREHQEEDETKYSWIIGCTDVGRQPTRALALRELAKFIIKGVNL